VILRNAGNYLPNDSITSQKTGIFRNTAVRTPTLTPVLFSFLLDEYVHNTPIACVLFGYTFLVQKHNIMVN
jgi:hypothetical protein